MRLVNLLSPGGVNAYFSFSFIANSLPIQKVLPDLACVAWRFEQFFNQFERWLSRIFRRAKDTSRAQREKYDCLWHLELKCEKRGAEERNCEGLRKKKGNS